jgi:hypothetical protein
MRIPFTPQHRIPTICCDNHCFAKPGRHSILQIEPPFPGRSFGTSRTDARAVARVSSSTLCRTVWTQPAWLPPTLLTPHRRLATEAGKCWRRGTTNPIIVILLSGILLALLILVSVILLNGRAIGPSTGAAAAVPDGTKIDRTALKDPPTPAQKAVGNADRIKETLRAGKTYRVVLKATFDARVADKDWGVKQVITLVYAAEMLVNRTIESNDGKRIVELRAFEKCRNVKLLCNVEHVSIELGPLGVLALGALDYLGPGSAEAIVAAKPIAELLLGTTAQQVLNDKATKAFARVDGLSGKRVRITYLDGAGVESLEPVGCNLTGDERDLLFSTAVLSDCYILPDLTLKPGQTWTVDGSELGGFLDPTLRGIPEGEIVVIRDADQTTDGKQFAVLRIQSGFLRINATDDKAHRVGTFEPHGKMKYSIDDGYVTIASLNGRATFERVSRDHILFEASFQTQPTMKVLYSCKMLP